MAATDSLSIAERLTVRRIGRDSCPSETTFAKRQDHKKTVNANLNFVWVEQGGEKEGGVGCGESEEW